MYQEDQLMQMDHVNTGAINFGDNFF